MREFKTERRLSKIAAAVKARQFSLHVVLENIHDPHNVSAILRSCDAVGVPRIALLYNVEPFPKLSRVVSASANKWIEKEKFKTTEECFGKLRSEGYKIYASALNEKAVDLHSIDFTQKISVVLGNEHRGVSEEVLEQADEVFYIPMYGMVQSLNVSVASAVILYEALRQRKSKGLYENNGMPQEDINNIIEQWCQR
ncbi:MAG TPA: RNA methyltransferase [Ignavibacteriales bacterium]|nr:RNA methyltransferase [Ignavibacteriales bacterium]